MKPQLATAPCVARSGVTPDGVIVPAKTLFERVEWLANITRGVAQQILVEHWNPESFNILNNGVGSDGRELPSQAAIAVRRLGWNPNTPTDVYVPDRVARCGWEQAMRLLKSAHYRENATRVIVESWPERAGFAIKHQQRRTRGEWEQLEKAETLLGVKLDKTTIRNQTRAIAKFAREYERLPTHLTELEQPPHVSQQVILSPTDKQLVSLTRVGDHRIALCVKLPLVANPQKRGGWERVVFEFTIGEHVPPNAVLKLPTLRLKNGRVLIDLAWEHPLPIPLARTGKRHRGHSRAVAVDWGVNTLLTAVTGNIDSTRAQNPIVRSDGRVYTFDGRGPALKLHRLREQTERLSTKIDHLSRLIEHTPTPRAVSVGLVAQVEQLQAERDHVSARRTNLSREIAWASACWLVDLAIAQKASVIYMEDLRSMEARGLGKRQNARCSNQVRGIVLTALRHQAAKHGITVVVVPARGTSKQCPRCLQTLKHVRAPNRLSEPGHAWAFCSHCGLSANRDHAAAQRVLSRGLAAQHSAHLDASKHWQITRVVDVPVRVTRTKRAAHRKAMGLPPKPHHGRLGKTGSTMKQSSRPNGRGSFGGVPSRRTVPATSPLGLVHRPAGPSPGSATRHVVVQSGNTFAMVPQRSRAPSKRARRAAGRGFHPMMHPTLVPRTSWRTLPVP